MLRDKNDKKLRLGVYRSPKDAQEAEPGAFVLNVVGLSSWSLLAPVRRAYDLRSGLNSKNRSPQPQRPPIAYI